jgi:hypothetical protein
MIGAVRLRAEEGAAGLATIHEEKVCHTTTLNSKNRKKSRLFIDCIEPSTNTPKAHHRRGTGETRTRHPKRVLSIQSF